MVTGWMLLRQLGSHPGWPRVYVGVCVYSPPLFDNAYIKPCYDDARLLSVPHPASSFHRQEGRKREREERERKSVSAPYQWEHKMMLTLLWYDIMNFIITPQTGEVQIQILLQPTQSMSRLHNTLTLYIYFRWKSEECMSFSVSSERGGWWCRAMMRLHQEELKAR